MASSITVPDIAGRKRRNGAPPIVMVTAYDTPFAHIVDEAGVDAILVGDSVGDNVLGMENTLSVTVPQMAHHIGAVARAKPKALIVGDMPWMSYHSDLVSAVENAAELVRAGAQAVKLEGGSKRLAVVNKLLDAEIPVMGHLGLTPQSVNIMGRMRVQARSKDAAKQLVADARALAEAGCFAIVLEGVPDAVGREVTEVIDIPTIGIGAGADCDGQVLVLHDILGLTSRDSPKFVRRYAEIAKLATSAVAAFATDVRNGSFPADEETYHQVSTGHQ